MYKSARANAKKVEYPKNKRSICLLSLIGPELKDEKKIEAVHSSL